MGREMLLTQEGRFKVIQDIKSQENIDRKVKSLRQFEVYRGNLYTYVYDYLSRQFQPQTLREIPIVASINIAKRVVDQEASIYDREPSRDWSELDDSQEEVMENIYADSKVNMKLSYSNAMYKLQDQNTLMIVPKNGAINIRVIKNHQIDAIPSELNPEIADAYIISSFDKEESFFTALPGYNAQGAYEIKSDTINQAIADQDDWKSDQERYLVWTRDENFIMNGQGEVIGEVLPNPLGDIMPFIDVSCEKDFEYWNRVASTTVDFCVEYNAALSMQNQVVKMQGFAQAWLKGTREVMPQQLQIGPNFVLHLVKGKDVDGNPVDTDFGYSNPSPDLQGSKEHLEMLLANFLSSNGLTSIVNSTGAPQYSSGIERLLAMIEQFEASRADFDVYRNVEEQLYEIIKRWHNLGVLAPKYTAGQIPDDSRVQVIFASPEMIKSEKEIVELAQLKEEIGVASKVDSIMAIYGLSRDEAKEKLLEIEEENGGQTEQILEPNPPENQRAIGGGPVPDVPGERPNEDGQGQNPPENN